MLIDLFQETWKELEAVAKDPKNPFRVCSLATYEEGEGIKQRMVNFRELTSSRSLLFYSDARSAKINHLRKTPEASVLFYNPIIRLQVFIRGKMQIHTHDELWETHRLKIEGRAINDYNTLYAPGKKIKNPVSVTRTTDLNFALLELQPDVVEYLKLREEPNRLRAIFRRNQDEWEKTYLVP